jgi:hypothetical protein
MAEQTEGPDDGFEVVEDYEIRSRRTWDRVVRDCEDLERWYPWCEFELRFARVFSFRAMAVVPHIQVWCRQRAEGTPR